MSDLGEIFRPESKSICQFFTDSGSFYYVPIYQRPYSWDRERVEQLWYDLVEAFENNQSDPNSDENYFLGTMVLLRKESGEEGYEVIDGQQRLTTLIILFCVLRDLKVDIGEKYKHLINLSIKDPYDGKRITLTTHLNDQANFEQTILNEINFDASKVEKGKNRFLQTAFYFEELVKNYQKNNHENLENLIKYIFERVTVIRIVCYSENSAIKLFTVLNDRGLDLNPADIIKSFLLSNLSEEEQKSFIEVWKRIETMLKSSNESIQNLLTYYLYYLKCENTKRSLQDELKKEFRNKKSLEIILDLERFVENFLEMDDNFDKDISMLKYLRQSVYWKSILLTAKQVEYKEYGQLKELIRKYYYQSWIADGTSNRVKQTSFSIIKKVKDKKPISEIKNLITENLNWYNNYTEYLDSEYVYWRTWHKPVLLAIEYMEYDSKEFIPLSTKLHTEHILPSGWDNEELDWKDKFSEESADNLLNSLGNLTLLSGTKNIRASNRNYSDKKEIYKGNSGKGFDGKTSFEITKRIIDEYPVWDENSIKKRHEWMVGRIQEIFDIGTE